MQGLERAVRRGRRNAPRHRQIGGVPGRHPPWMMTATALPDDSALSFRSEKLNYYRAPGAALA